MENTIRVNSIPSPTWNWLHMNDVDIPEVLGKKSALSYEIPEEYHVSKREDFSLTNIKTGMGDEISKAVLDSKNILSMSLSEGLDAEIARLNFDYKESSVDGVEIILGKNSKATVVMNMSGLSDGEMATLQTRYKVDSGSTLTLVQIETVSRKSRFNNDIGGVVAENGDFRLIQLILGGHDNSYGVFSELEGTRANFASDVAYSLNDDETLDINTVSNHTGKKTNCDINVSGVLRGTSKKNFKGTIDFHRGCKGATGNEMESVLLMDDDVRNQTIPVILCDEEDVEGNHGASIGRIDEDLMFYMESRGMDRTAIYETMAKAFVDKVVMKIPDSVTREAYLND